jgi:hypothetical protein
VICPGAEHSSPRIVKLADQGLRPDPAAQEAVGVPQFLRSFGCVFHPVQILPQELCVITVHIAQSDPFQFVDPDRCIRTRVAVERVQKAVINTHQLAYAISAEILKLVSVAVELVSFQNRPPPIAIRRRDFRAAMCASRKGCHDDLRHLPTRFELNQKDMRSRLTRCYVRVPSDGENYFVTDPAREHRDKSTPAGCAVRCP